MRVLLVDNDPGALELLELDLRLEGHDVVGTAGQGAEGVELCERLAPDVAVVDYRMPPGIDGLEAARRIRERAPGVRVVLYSNHVRPDLLAIAAGLDVAYLPKGDLAALRRAVAGSS